MANYVYCYILLSVGKPNFENFIVHFSQTRESIVDFDLKEQFFIKSLKQEDDSLTSHSKRKPDF